uniref:Uncharacterized protein n=1 Tax=mine drainage metagenome TaxID=410659 RepID=E6PWP1_9ZZZZ
MLDAAKFFVGSGEGIAGLAKAAEAEAASRVRAKKRTTFFMGCISC